MDNFSDEPIDSHDIVMLGDSLTAWGDWNVLLPGYPFRNRGIPGDTVAGVLARLDPIVRAQPTALFLMIGTNDLSPFFCSQDRQIFAGIESILLRLCRETAFTRLFVQSILPREAMLAPRIRNLNRRIEQLARTLECTYLDLFDSFATPAGGLRPEFSEDGVHLSAAGYRQWASLLRPHLAALVVKG